MPLELTKPISYLITGGTTRPQTTRTSPEFRDVLTLVRAAVGANVSLIQIREKNLTDRTLFHLALDAAAITAGSNTRLLINRRADIARLANADGVHLPTEGLSVAVIRKTFGESFLIGVSTHSVPELVTAEASQADFAVFGPVFKTPSKQAMGFPMGVEALKKAVDSVTSFRVLALGGINLNNAVDCFRVGASGLAAIRMFDDPNSLGSIIQKLRQSYEVATR